MAISEAVHCEECGKELSIDEAVDCAPCEQLLCLDCFVDSNCPDNPNGHVTESGWRG